MSVFIRYFVISHNYCSEHKQFKKYEDEKGYDVLFNNSKYEDIYRIEQLYTIWCSFLENGVKWHGKL